MFPKICKFSDFWKQNQFFEKKIDKNASKRNEYVVLFVQSFAQENVRLLQNYLAGLLNCRTFAALFFKSVSFYGFNLLQDR